jgi:hypothetical protein
VRYLARPGSPPGTCGFLPSRDGFGFPNAWPSSPALTLRTPLGPVGIGDSAAGLCGGMVFAALDYWHARFRPPARLPEPGSPLHRYVVRRLIASWRIPAGVARYYMWGTLTDREVARRTIAAVWPRVRASLDDGIPAPLGLVTVASANPARMRHNHQALAYAYELSGGEVVLRVYDPNSGPADGVGIRFGVSPGRAATFAHNLNLGWPVRGFFLVPYSPAAPPAWTRRVRDP